MRRRRQGSTIRNARCAGAHGMRPGGRLARRLKSRPVADLACNGPDAGIRAPPDGICAIQCVAGSRAHARRRQAGPHRLPGDGTPAGTGRAAGKNGCHPARPATFARMEVRCRGGLCRIVKRAPGRPWKCTLRNRIAVIARDLMSFYTHLPSMKSANALLFSTLVMSVSKRSTSKS